MEHAHTPAPSDECYRSAERLCAQQALDGLRELRGAKAAIRRLEAAGDGPALGFVLRAAARAADDARWRLESCAMLLREDTSVLDDPVEIPVAGALEIADTAR